MFVYLIFTVSFSRCKENATWGHESCDLNITQASAEETKTSDVWSEEETETFITFIHETNRTVIFPSWFPVV